MAEAKLTLTRDEAKWLRNALARSVNEKSEACRRANQDGHHAIADNHRHVMVEYMRLDLKLVNAMVAAGYIRYASD